MDGAARVASSLQTLARRAWQYYACSILLRGRGRDSGRARRKTRRRWPKPRGARVLARSSDRDDVMIVAPHSYVATTARVHARLQDRHRHGPAGRQPEARSRSRAAPGGFTTTNNYYYYYYCGRAGGTMIPRLARRAAWFGRDTMRRGAAQCVVVRCGAVCYGAVWCGAVWCGVVWCVPRSRRVSTLAWGEGALSRTSSEVLISFAPASHVALPDVASRPRRPRTGGEENNLKVVVMCS